MAKIYILEYSSSQKSFHTTTIDDACANNIKNLVLQKQHDYHIVGWSDNSSAINKLPDTLRSNYPEIFQ